ncbi:lamina-associated polypeptide 2 isoform gamma [Mus musculus]|uniref:Isoform Delta of Lamina-associated polypeptide 2, isoforms beta/delta/epsilon/gamma n=1 Tax=Mus musculus TaxID=10090 RepID=Q61029-2|nr:lamina-associated polypeptide 2 isoform gamma [Mus musculus]EDL21532.1 thymopoietin, isoform CRA_c [Mus musculus]|eukprot:NP_001073600.1 lamina-associated polypeptide 2 isoform gamma [Mus musculus]
MPEFLEDPSVLTKDKLKSELVANNVTLPAGEQRKDVYVQLYLQHLTARNRPPLAAGANSKGPPDFSSDEEREPTPVLGSGASVGRGRGAVGRKATKKTDKPRLEDKDDLDVTELSNEELLDQLVRYGVNPGPIVGTTRKLYEKKLLKLREQGTESRSSTPLPTVSSSAENTRQNGSNDSDRYSDNDEDSKIELKLEKREPLKGRAKTPVTLKQRRTEHNQVANRLTGNFKHASSILPITEFSDITRRTPKKPLTRAEVGEKTEERRVDRDILKEMFPYEASTPTGISASCRRPIKGAAGRPLELSDFRMEESFSSKYVPKYAPLADVKSEKTKKRRSVPMWIKMLLFALVAVFLFLVYQAMETNQGNPFTNFLQDTKISN